MSNSVQLKHVLKQAQPNPFYGTQVALGIISILMCATIGEFEILFLFFFSVFFSESSIIFVYIYVFLRFMQLVVVITTFPYRILGFVQLYTFLFTRLDHLPLLLPSMANLTRYDQFFIILPIVLTIFLFLFDIIFLIIMFIF